MAEVGCSSNSGAPVEVIIMVVEDEPSGPAIHVAALREFGYASWKRAVDAKLIRMRRRWTSRPEIALFSRTL